jgi:hypothetical protein
MKLLLRKLEEIMPKGTKVEKLYEKLKAQGKSKGSAAAIAQSVTGLSLKTGKKPKKSQNAFRSMAGEED